MTDREAFEQWGLSKEGPWLPRSYQRRPGTGEYYYTDVAYCWMGWQAALAYAREQASQAPARSEPAVPEGWHLSTTHLNEPQIASITRLLQRLMHAHMIDLRVRINGQWEEYEAAWVKNLRPLLPAAPLPQVKEVDNA